MANNKQLATRAPSGGNQLPASPRPPGSTLLALAQALLDKSKNAGKQAVAVTGRAARATGRAARAVGKVAPEKAADMAIDEGAALASHATAHVTHRYLGVAGVGVKGLVELIALIAARVKRAPPWLTRGLRSSLRGTLHHSLGTGLHRTIPLETTSRRITTSGDEGEGEDVGAIDADGEEVAEGTEF